MTASLELKNAELKELDRELSVVRKQAAGGEPARTTSRLRELHLETARASLRYQQARLDEAKARLAVCALMKHRYPGAYDAKDAEKAEADAANAADLCGLRADELKALEPPSTEPDR